MGISKYKESSSGTYYHLYNRGNQRRKIFYDREDYELYLSKMIKTRTKHKFAITAYCLMPNHVHLIVRQEGDMAPAKFISSLHTGYAMMFNKKYNLVGHLFQDRFKQKIISDDDYMKRLIAYVHLNPVKDDICNLPKEYRWSSYLEYARAGRSLNIDGICDCRLAEGYRINGMSFEEFIDMTRGLNNEDTFDD